MPEDNPQPEGSKLKERVSALEKQVEQLAKGLKHVDDCLEGWEGDRAVPRGTIAGVPFPGPEE